MSDPDFDPAVRMLSVTSGYAITQYEPILPQTACQDQGERGFARKPIISLYKSNTNRSGSAIVVDMIACCLIARCIIIKYLKVNLANLIISGKHVSKIIID
jgi:hypothetical protein